MTSHTLLIGPPASGKSTRLREIAAQAEQYGFNVLHLDAYGQSPTATRSFSESAPVDPTGLVLVEAGSMIGIDTRPLESALRTLEAKGYSLYIAAESIDFVPTTFRDGAHVERLPTRRR